METLFIKGTKNEVFVLFHGTGGNEESLLPIVGDIDANASVISFLGSVGTGKNRRFFAPLMGPRIVDAEDLEARVHLFYEEWQQWKETVHGQRVTFVGFSNGANFILAMMEKYPDIADMYILLHPSNLGYRWKKSPRGKILFTVGANDTFASPGEVVTMNKTLEKLGATTELILVDGAHAITQAEINTLKKKLEEEQWN